ncbi:hypothetical protein F4677DRAFT_412113 [Hypoxylon crocopeplum]|nr:hypothetical protein F4677DRAFT_412113 [Hypoxylon crocopeplum]
MVKGKPGKRKAPQAEASRPGPAAKRTKANSKEEDETKKLGVTPARKRGRPKKIPDPVEVEVEVEVEAEAEEPNHLEDSEASYHSDEEPKETLSLKELEALFPPKIIKDLKATKPSSGSPSSNKKGATAVYTVMHLKSAAYESPELDILGTYSTPDAANVRVLSFFSDEYDYVTSEWAELRDSKPKAWRNGEVLLARKSRDRPDHEGVNYWIDACGLLSLWAEAGECGARVYSLRQELRTDGLGRGGKVAVFSGE